MIGIAGARSAGMAVPLFALKTAQSWGIGEILDLVPLAAWAASMGQRIVQILPINECAPGEASPYGALSAFAIDPLYLSVGAVEDLAAEQRGRVPDDVPRPDATGSLPRSEIREVKLRVLAEAWRRFQAAELGARSRRGEHFLRFVRRERFWLEDYALFRALKEVHGWRHWDDWPAPQARREAAALTATRRRYHDRIGFWRYLQWLAAEQWDRAREGARAHGVYLKGDLSFVIGRDSADGWADRDRFVPGWEIGAPPDDFSASGQNWGLPLYDWARMRATDFAWWRERVRWAAERFDLFRIDHIVGVFRTYGIPIAPGGEPRFHPASEPEQIEQGDAFLRMLRAAGGSAVAMAEDLGTIPDFVRDALRAHRVPGYKVLRWEWRDGAFIDPARYDPVSVATSGTHDTTTLAEWWPSLPPDQQTNLIESLGIPADAGAVRDRLTPALRRLILERLYGAGSAYTILPIQDLFGWTARINVPMSVSPTNWNFRLPFEIGAAGEVPREIAEEGPLLRAQVVAAGRGGGAAG